MLKLRLIILKNQLRINQKNPKEFWRIIHNIIAPKVDVISKQRFYDSETGCLVDIGNEPDFLNKYFTNIVDNLDISLSNDMCCDVYNIDRRFCFSDDLPTIPEIINLINEIDVYKSSCVKDINTRFCKESMLAIPQVICSLLTKSLTSGVIPKAWVEGMITLIPKDCDLTQPGNWRPITQTSIFAKLLEKLVYSRLLCTEPLSTILYNKTLV